MAYHLNPEPAIVVISWWSPWSRRRGGRPATARKNARNPPFERAPRRPTMEEPRDGGIRSSRKSRLLVEDSRRKRATSARDPRPAARHPEARDRLRSRCSHMSSLLRETKAHPVELARAFLWTDSPRLCPSAQDSTLTLPRRGLRSARIRRGAAGRASAARGRQRTVAGPSCCRPRATSTGAAPGCRCICTKIGGSIPGWRPHQPLQQLDRAR